MRWRLAVFGVVAGLVVLAWTSWRRDSQRAGATRLVDLLPVVPADAPPPPRIVSEFRFASNTEGWAPFDSDAAVTAVDGALLVKIMPAIFSKRVDEQRLPPVIARDADIDTRDVDALAIRMTLLSTKIAPRVYWVRAEDPGFSRDRSVPIPAVLDGTSREYHVPLADNPFWTGRVVRVGLVLSQLASEVRIERIAFERIGLAERVRYRRVGGSLPKVRIGTELRETVVVSPGSERTFEIDVPVTGSLEVGLAIIGCVPAESEPPASLEVVVESGDETARTSHEFGGDLQPIWVSERLDLSALAGRAARVRLRASGGGEREWAGCFGSPSVVGPREPGPNVVLISIDTLRADHVHAYGYSRETSPHIDRLAAEGARFADALSAASFTLASHMSLMTSLWPSFHGVNDNNQRLRDGIPTLAQKLRDAGYRTVAQVEDGYVAADFGFHRGFEEYDDAASSAETRPYRAQRTFRRAAETIERLAGQKFFLFVHTYGPHTPYNAPEPWCSMFDPDYRGSVKPGFGYTDAQRASAGLTHLDEADARHVMALYDGGVRAADEAVGEFLARLEALGLARDTLVVLVSDHGEEFLEHGIGLAMHGYSVYQEMLHVPFIARWPKRIPAGTVVNGRVSLVDVFPTVLGLLGLESTRGLLGEDLTPRFRGAPEKPRILVAQELRLTNETTIVSGSVKFIRMARMEPAVRRLLEQDFPPLVSKFPPDGRDELYDLAGDPGEKNNLASDRAADVAEFGAAVRRLLESGEAFRRAADATTAADGIDPGLAARIKSLGYVGGGR